MAIVSTKRTQLQNSPSKNKVTINSPLNKSKPSGTSPKKRDACPGIRVKGARIYDSKDGKTCHQCRQKTRDFNAACMNQREGKPCTVRFCHKCLLNRYGEQAEVVVQLGVWNCPKCRGICNCSFCMKKKGHQPTGQLVFTAKANGFSSVSQMLQGSTVECLDSKKDVQNIGISPSEPVANDKAKPTSPIGAQKKFTQDVVEVVNERRGQSPVGVVQARVTRQSAEKARVLKEVSNVDVTTVVIEKDQVAVKPQCNADLNNCKVGDKKQHNIKRQACTQMHCNDIEMKTSPQPEDRKYKKLKQDGSQKEEYPSIVIEAVPKKPDSVDIELNKEVKADTLKDNVDETNLKKYTQGNCSMAFGVEIENSSKPHIPLPRGTELMNVSGIEIPSEDVGNVLQFLEFCAVFGKVIDVKKGQAEAVVRDILQGRTTRRGKHSLTVNFLIQLLSVIQEDDKGSPSLSPHGKNSWINSLKQCISDSRDVAKLLDLDKLDEGAHVYESLTSSQKLKLLNFLCDEILRTSTIRERIDEETAKLAEKTKEVKNKVLAAKDKEKCLKQKIQDDIAKAVLANNGAPLSISEHDAITSKIKTKAAQAHAEVLESQGLLSKGNQISNTVRIQPILDASDGRAYWRLNFRPGKSDILSQDLGSGDTISLKEKWSAFDDDEKRAIEKHISLLALKEKWEKKLGAKRSYNTKAKEVVCNM